MFGWNQQFEKRRTSTAGKYEVSFEEVELWGNKYSDVVARYDISIDDIEMEAEMENRMQQSRKK